jgi:hypothetical protein
VRRQPRQKVTDMPTRCLTYHMHAGSLPSQILEALRHERKPMTATELWLKHFPETTIQRVSDALTKMHRRTYPDGSTRAPNVRISDWKWVDMDNGLRLRAMYSPGKNADAPRPPAMTRAEINERYRAKNGPRTARGLTRRVPASVFHLAGVMAAEQERAAP